MPRKPQGGSPKEQKKQSASSQGPGQQKPAAPEAEAEAEGNAASASSGSAVTAAASDADADAGDARSRLTASPRAAAGDDRAVASNVNIVLLPDLGTTMAALLVAMSAGRGAGGLGAPEAELFRSLAAQQRRTSQELIQALQSIAAKGR